VQWFQVSSADGCHLRYFAIALDRRGFKTEAGNVVIRYSPEYQKQTDGSAR